MSANRRDVQYKRHHRHVARDLPQNQDKTQPVIASPSPSLDPQTSDVATPSSSQAPASKTSDPPANTKSHPTSSSATPTPSSTPSPSSSPLTSSSASDSASATSAASSIASSQSAVSLPIASHASISTKVVVPGASLTSSLSSTPTSTQPSGSSGGTNTGTIVGGIAGALAGIALLGFLLMWCMRRQRNRDLDDFDAQAFKRQSAMLVDDPVEPPQSYNPRPPTMIERHNASPALAAQAGYGGQNFYGNYGGYGQQPSYAPEMIQPVGSPPPQAYGAPPMGYAAYNDPQQPIGMQPSNVGYPAYDTQQQQLARQPSNAQYLTRQASAAAGYPPPNTLPGSVEPGAQYIDLRRSSVSPYQAAQYADISRQLGTVDPNAQDALALPDDPLPSPFDDPVEPTQGASSHVAAPVPAAVPVPHAQADAAQPRPATVYHESDAYGGI